MLNSTQPTDLACASNARAYMAQRVLHHLLDIAALAFRIVICFSVLMVTIRRTLRGFVSRDRSEEVTATTSPTYSPMSWEDWREEAEEEEHGRGSLLGHLRALFSR